jgi:nucleoside-diphosphate-sugar epimerase
MRGDHDPVNVGNPNEFTVQQLAEMVLELTGSKSAIERHPLPTDDPRVRKPDITRAKSLLEWEPVVQVRDGLKQTINFFRSLNDKAVAAP